MEVKEPCCVSLTVMTTDYILSLLVAERDKLSAAIEALQSGTRVAEAAPAAQAKRKLSAAGRRAIIAGTKKRWAALKSAKAATAAPTPAPVKAAAPAKKKGGLTEAGRKALSIAMKKRWVARKKAAAKKKAA